MLSHDTTRRFPALPVAVKVITFLTAGVKVMLGQTCATSPDKTGGPQYNQPPALFALDGVTPQAWPQDYVVYYVEYSGTYNGYATSFPSDYQTAISTAYTNYNNASNNSLLEFDFWGTSISGLNSIESYPDPDYVPWHEWIIVNQADLPAGVNAETRSQFQNYGSDASPYIAIGNSVSRVSNQMSLAGDDVSFSASTFAHEIGHTLALDDCYNCQGGTGGTIMTAANSFLAHFSGNITGPQYCDNQQTLSTAYFRF
jgi:hypothetical protein